MRHACLCLKYFELVFSFLLKEQLETCTCTAFSDFVSVCKKIYVVKRATACHNNKGIILLRVATIRTKTKTETKQKHKMSIDIIPVHHIILLIFMHSFTLQAPRACYDAIVFIWYHCQQNWFHKISYFAFGSFGMFKTLIFIHNQYQYPWHVPKQYFYFRFYLQWRPLHPYKILFIYIQYQCHLVRQNPIFIFILILIPLSIAPIHEPSSKPICRPITASYDPYNIPIPRPICRSNVSSFVSQN